ncbi:MAG: MarR family winged helix-turn-helix transcriptional regulator [Thermocrispum sp.]
MDRAKANAVEGWESLFRAQVAVLRRLRDGFRGAEISLGEYDVLYNLTRFPGGRLRLRELNQNVLLTQPSLSRLVERMEQRGLVRRERDAADGRGTVVVMTDEGAAVQRRVGREHAEAISRYVGGPLGAEELRELQRLCDNLRFAQGEIDDWPGD